MKIILSSLLLNLFVFVTTQYSVLSTASDVIHDSAGNRLLGGVPYYILPLLRGTGGGLTVSRSTKNACPLNVTQELFEVNYGVPFTFSPIVLDEDFIRSSYPTSIEAYVTNPCSGTNIWKVTAAKVAKNDDDERVTSNKDKDKDKKKDEDDQKDSVKIVTGGGEFNTPESCFQIVEEDMMPGLRSYQIQHCPFKCGSSSSPALTCYNVGLISDADGTNYLAPTDALFPVVFTSSISTSTQSSTKVSFFSQAARLNTFSRSVK